MLLNPKRNLTSRDITSFAIVLALFFGALGGVALWRPDALVAVSIFLGIAWLVSLFFNREVWHTQMLGFLLPLLLFAVGGSVEEGADPWTVAGVTWAAGAGLALVTRGWLKLGRLIYTAWMSASLPIGWTISHLILAFTYYLVLTPIGLIMRLLGYDPMHRKFDPEAKTYWVEHQKASDTSRYFQQF